MEFVIGIGGGTASGEGLEASLRRWLAADPELRGEVAVVAPPGLPAPGAMGGGGLDVVNVVVSNAIALGSLLVALAGWRSARPRPPQLTLERNGVVVTVHDASPETVEQVLALFAGTPECAETPESVASGTDRDDA
ncbi:hypothetical protein [Streptomyces sp. NPDC052107]|uniref:effector-associated constant component EACC1 n=1 Tax=Streptomyces sp. NPDC052107 TaxID=3155632 RepID=UPI00343F77C9